MAMTYRELIENLQSLPDERLDDTVTVFVSGVGEFYPVIDESPFVVANGRIQSELDDGHPYIVI